MLTRTSRLPSLRARADLPVRPRTLAILVLAATGVFVLGLFLRTLADVSATPPGALSPAAVVVSSAVIVLREGLEAILVLAAVVASLRRTKRRLRRPVALGGGLALLATAATWLAAVALLDSFGLSVEELQALTGLIGVVVLLLATNWFLHRLYWTGWISYHTERKRRLLGRAPGAVLVGFVLLGFTAVYREGFEVVVLLQGLRLQAGSTPVLAGMALGLALTVAVGALTFRLGARLPFKRMLIVTGVLLGVVLVVMVGATAHAFQQAGWLTTTSIGAVLPAPVSAGFGLFPTVETLAAQAAAVAIVLGSYILAEHLGVGAPRNRELRRLRLAGIPVFPAPFARPEPDPVPQARIGRVGLGRRAAAVAGASALVLGLALAWGIRPAVLAPSSGSLRGQDVGSALHLAAWALFVMVDLVLLAHVLSAGARRRWTAADVRRLAAHRPRRQGLDDHRPFGPGAGSSAAEDDGPDEPVSWIFRRLLEQGRADAEARQGRAAVARRGHR